MKALGIVAAILFVATVYAANYAVEHWGLVSVGFGLMAPAGVWFAGVAFTLRDIVHRTLGRWVVIGAILIGGLLSYVISDAVTLPGGLVSLAVASAIAFLVSEMLDLAVYEPIRSRGWLPAVVASNIVGLVTDSILFLWLAFGSLAFLSGQVVGKAWMTLLAIALLALVWRLPRFRREAIA